MMYNKLAKKENKTNQINVKLLKYVKTSKHMYIIYKNYKNKKLCFLYKPFVNFSIFVYKFILNNTEIIKNKKKR